MAEPTKYPEHEKLQKIAKLSQACGEFLTWLGGEGLTLCEYNERHERFYPAGRSTMELLAAHFEIDQNRLEAEKQTMLEELRRSVCERLLDEGTRRLHR